MPSLYSDSTGFDLMDSSGEYFLPELPGYTAPEPLPSIDENDDELVSVLERVARVAAELGSCLAIRRITL